MGREQRLGDELPARPGRRGALRLRRRLRRTGRGRPHARDRDRRRADPPARGRARRERAAARRQRLRARGTGRGGRHARAVGRRRRGASAVVCRGRGRRAPAGPRAAHRSRATTSSCRSGDAPLRPAPELPRERRHRRARAAAPSTWRACDRRPRGASVGTPAGSAARPRRRRRARTHSCRGKRSSAAQAARPTTPSSGGCATRELAGLFGELPRVEGDAVVFGPGAALVPHDELWYADLPKRHALAAVRRGEAPNAGQRAGTRGTEPRLLFVDWPLLDRYKQELLPSIDRYLDLSEPDAHRHARRRRASPDAGRCGTPSVPHAADVLSRPLGRAVAPRRARRREGRAEPRVVVRADRARRPRSSSTASRSASSC